MNLFDFYNDVVNIFDETEAVDVIYLDFQRTFNKVPHKRLLSSYNDGATISTCLRHQRAWDGQEAPQIAYRRYRLKRKKKKVK